MYMRRLSLIHQILLAPAAVIGCLVVLLMLLISQLSVIQQQNESVREWGYAIEHLTAAAAAGRRMNGITVKLRADSPEEQGDLHFSYLEQSILFSSNLLHPTLLSKLDSSTRGFLRRHEIMLRYHENLDPAEHGTALASVLARLTEIDSALWAQKRAAYAQYYENVKDAMPRLIKLSLASLVLFIALGAALSWWTSRRITKRLEEMAQCACAICAGQFVSMPKPTRIQDELDSLAACLSTMTERLINVVSSEKLLEGAEEERRRIAMDLHDQTLSDLTALARSLHDLKADVHGSSMSRARKLSELDAAVHEAIANVRAIMDDLHPQTLDMLGLESALRSYLDKQSSRPGLPLCHLHVDETADQLLSRFQCLMLYRVGLEAINNALRHSQCNRLEVSLRCIGDGLILTVEDNGIGFSYDHPKTSGRGLANIMQRAQAISAEVRLTSSRFSSGTRFELRLTLSTIPFHMREEELGYGK